MFRFLFLTLFPVVSGISSKCLQEFGAIYESGTYQATETDSLEALAATFDQSGCSFGETTSCTFDFSTVSDVMEPICKENGGTFNKWTFSISCAQEGVSNLEFTYVNIPACAGTCCTNAEMQELIGQESDITTADQEFVDAGYSCESSIDYSEGSDGEGCEDSAAPSLGQSSLLVSVTMSGLWWLYNL